MMEEMAVARAPASPSPLASLLAPRRLAGLAVAEIVALYLVTRLGLIGRFPWFVDEGIHGRFTDRFSHDFGDAFISLSIAKEPLSIWIGGALTKLGFTPLAATRMVSFLAGLLTLAMVGLLGRKLGGLWAGVAAMAAYAVLPLFVVHDVIGIMDPLVTAFITSALYLQIELAERPRAWVSVALAFALGLGILTKEGAKVAVVLLPLSLLCFDWTGPDVRRRLVRWLAFAALGVAGAAAGLLVLHSSSEWHRAEVIRKIPLLYPVRSVHDALSDPTRFARENWPVYRATLAGYVTLPVVAAAIVGFVLVLRERTRLALVVGGWLVVMGVAALLLPVSPYPRHALFFVPALLALAGVGLARGGAALHGALGRGRVAAGAVAAALLLVFAVALVRDARVLAHPSTAHYPDGDDVQYVTGVQGGAIWPDVADELRRRTGGRPAVVIRSKAAVDVISLLLARDGIRFVFADRRAARRATLLLRDDIPFPDVPGDALLARRGPGMFRLVREFPRPRGGTVVRIYERGP
jgi:Dolichyl-phosphate-mannose-protein mannosyltransferase